MKKRKKLPTTTSQKREGLYDLSKKQRLPERRTRMMTTANKRKA